MEPENRDDALTRLLLDYNKSQASVIKHLRNIAVLICICFTIIICSLVVGFFWYESQFDKTVTTVTQEVETDEGNAIVNSGGDMYYGDED